MQMKNVRSTPRHDVDPAIGHCQFATLEVPIERIRKCLYMPLQLAFQRCKRRRDSLQSVRRTIGGITARVVLRGPSATRRVVFSKLPSFFQKLPVEFSGAGALQGRGVDEGGEQRLDGHPLKTSGGPRTWESRRSGSAEYVRTGARHRPSAPRSGCTYMLPNPSAAAPQTESFTSLNWI